MAIQPVRNTAPTRLLRVMAALKSGNTTSAELARMLDVDPRSVRRYMNRLKEEHGVDVYLDRATKTYRINGGLPTQLTSDLLASPREAMALALAVGTLRGALPKRTPGALDDALAHLAERLLRLFPKQEAQLRQAMNAVDLVASPLPCLGDEWVEPLLTAIQDNRRLTMNYQPSGRAQAAYNIDPYHLRHYLGAWYMVGYDTAARRFKVFHLARVRSLSPENHFSPRDFDPADFFADSLGIWVSDQPIKPVRLRLTGHAAQRVRECVLPKGFGLEDGPDGAVDLVGKVATLADLQVWARGWGSEAKFLEGADGQNLSGESATIPSAN